MGREPRFSFPIRPVPFGPVTDKTELREKAGPLDTAHGQRASSPHLDQAFGGRNGDKLRGVRTRREFHAIITDKRRSAKGTLVNKNQCKRGFSAPGRTAKHNAA